VRRTRTSFVSLARSCHMCPGVLHIRYTKLRCCAMSTPLHSRISGETQLVWHYVRNVCLYGKHLPPSLFLPHPTQTTPSSPSHAVSHSEQRTASRGTPHARPHHLNPHGPANASFVATAAARRHSGRRVHINTASIPFVPQARYVQHATRCKSHSLCLHDRIPTAPTAHQRS
jgi:hypothetical protein